jgi:hypothetical protein
MKVPARVDPATGNYEERLNEIIAELWPPEKQKPKRTRPPVGGINFSKIKPAPVHRYVFLGFPRPDTWTIYMAKLMTKKEIREAMRRVETGEEVPLP